MKTVKIACAVVVGLAMGCSEKPAASDAPPSPNAPGPRPSPTARIQPGDLVYRGAFRLPDEPEEVGWGWSGQALAYCPDGDPDGPDDGTPGSLFGTGHNWHQQVSEITIPGPVVSRTKNVRELKTARTLQKFRDIRGNRFGDLEQARAGLAYLPKQGKQKTGKLYFCWGPHMHEAQAVPSHGWCERNLSAPRQAGPWCIGKRNTYTTTDYIFTIPKAWADRHTPGLRLATGRFRDGGQGGQGPTLYAYGPWNHGNPPARGTRLRNVQLLQYATVYTQDRHVLNDYHHADEWSGGAWLTAGNRGAVIFVGTKGRGKCWYGFANGVVWPERGPFPPVPAAPNDQRGWWSTRFEGLILFYDPADLAAVAAGRMKAHAPQPYATLAIDEFLFAVRSPRQVHHVGAATFDRARGLLYVIEPRADGDKSIIHV
jgi:hypothetical protein